MFWDIEPLISLNNGLYDDSEGKFCSYGELLERVTQIEKCLRQSRKLLVALFCDNSLAGIAAYLASLRSGNTVILINSSTEEGLRHRILSIYRPEIVIMAFDGSKSLPEGYSAIPSPSSMLAVAVAKELNQSEIFLDTAVLLSTSGTVGSPKLVRLSYRNIQSNADSIKDYLGIDSSDVAITSLPVSYSYGLSVVNSHLLSGASLVCTNSSLFTNHFWSLFRQHRCSSLAGVPFSYNILERLRFDRMDLPSLRILTQAGGRLASDKIEYFSAIASKRNYHFFVMYGQTEATARISYLPPEKLLGKIGSVGIAIPGGEIGIFRDGREVLEPNVDGEVVYKGANVMLGYADTRECLAKGDEMQGCLFTGDQGHKDNDGYLYITGRLKRFIKVFGLRLNLDEVEKMLEAKLSCPVACAGSDESLHVYIESRDNAIETLARDAIISLYHLHHSAVNVQLTSAILVTESGKKDYKAMEMGSRS